MEHDESLAVVYEKLAAVHEEHREYERAIELHEKARRVHNERSCGWYPRSNLRIVA